MQTPSLSTPGALPGAVRSVLKHSPALFVAALLCFLLPFVTLSCQGQELARLSGLDLVFGSEIQQPTPMGQPKTTQMPGSLLFGLVAGASLAGLGLSLRARNNGSRTPAGAGVLGLLFLLMGEQKLVSDVAAKGSGMIRLEVGPGFWGVGFLLAASVALHLLDELLQRQLRNTPGSRASAPGLPESVGQETAAPALEAPPEETGPSFQTVAGRPLGSLPEGFSSTTAKSLLQ